MKSLSKVISFACMLFVGQSAYAVLEIEITQGIEGALPIAIVAFAGDVYTAPEVVENIVRDDLQRSGFFDVLGKQRFPQIVTDPSQLNYKVWRDAGVESLLLGKVTKAGAGQYRVEFQLFDLIRQKRLLGHVVPATIKDVRKVGHKISDLVFEKLTGIRGAFSTRIAYVSTINKNTANQKYVLQIADADGHNARTVFSSSAFFFASSTFLRSSSALFCASRAFFFSTSSFASSFFFSSSCFSLFCLSRSCSASRFCRSNSLRSISSCLRFLSSSNCLELMTFALTVFIVGVRFGAASRFI